MYRGGIGLVMAHKITQEKLAIFLETLNYNKSSWIIFCAKMFQCSHYKYCLQEESRHCGLRVSTYFDLGVSEQFESKNHNRKLSDIHRDL